MKNIINEFPATDLHGGQLYAINNFLRPQDLAGKDILDIGCGFGWFEQQAMKREVKKIVAMDHTDEDLKTIRKLISVSAARSHCRSPTTLLIRL